MQKKEKLINIMPLKHIKNISWEQGNIEYNKCIYFIYSLAKIIRSCVANSGASTLFHITIHPGNLHR